MSRQRQPHESKLLVIVGVFFQNTYLNELCTPLTFFECKYNIANCFKAKYNPVEHLKKLRGKIYLNYLKKKIIFKEFEELKNIHIIEYITIQ